MNAPALSVLGVGTDREHWQGFGVEPSLCSQVHLPTVYNASSSQCEYCQALCDECDFDTDTESDDGIDDPQLDALLASCQQGTTTWDQA